MTGPLLVTAIIFAPVLALFVGAYRLAMAEKDNAAVAFLVCGGALGLIDLIPLAKVVLSILPQAAP